MNGEWLQYIIIGAVLVAALLYLVKVFRPGKGRKKGCCGCDSCGSADRTDLRPR